MNSRTQRVINRMREFGPDKILLLVSALLIFLVVVQSARLAFAARLGRGLIDSLAARDAGPLQRKDVKSLDEYKPVTQKGILGAPPGQPPPQRLFGIMGDMALIGSSPDDARTYTVGAEIPGGEKLVEIAYDYVTLEKDGNQRKEEVFPAKQAGEGRVVELPGPGGGGPSGPPRAEPRPGRTAEASPPQPQVGPVPDQQQIDIQMKMEQARMAAEQEAQQSSQPRVRGRR